MKIVIPVSSHDKHLINDFCSVLNFLGPYLNHELLVVARPADSEFAIQVFCKLKSIFPISDIFIFEKDGTLGWPQGPNYYWRETIKHLLEIENQLPWLWMELDCTPVKKDWANSLEKEYNESKSKCLGMIQPFILRDKDATHLVGVAIYPPDFHMICNSWETLNDDCLAFDIHCQEEVIKISENSKLMQHNFRTYDYVCIDKVISGEIKEERHRKYNFHRPIEDDVVLVHGCDDGSLARVIMNQ